MSDLELDKQKIVTVQNINFDRDAPVMDRQIMDRSKYGVVFDLQHTRKDTQDKTNYP